MDRKIRVVLLEDSRQDGILVQKALEKAGAGIEMTRTETEKGFIEELDKSRPDVVLSDYSLPDYDVYSAFGHVKKRYPEVPFIIVSGRIGEEFAVEALKTGVTDYVMKDRLERLAPSVIRALNEAEAISRYRKISSEKMVSESKYQKLFNNAYDAIMLLDSDGSVEERNILAGNILREAGLDSPDQKLDALFIAADRTSVRDFISRVLSEGQGKLTDKTMELSGNKYITVDMSASVIGFETGPRLLLICRDITDRKNSDLKIAKYQDILRLLTGELSMVEERERRRIAADLHDTIAQSLALAKMKTEMLRSSGLTAGQTEQCTEILDLVNQSIRITRSLISELSPPILYELGLSSALDWLCDQMSEKYAIAAVYQDEGLGRGINEQTDITLFKAVRELLFNVIKHAKATEVLIRAWKSEDKLNIVVQDNGIGFDQERLDVSTMHSGSGFGLFNIRERLLSLGGSMDIDTQPGMGCRIRLILPVKQESIGFYQK